MTALHWHVTTLKCTLDTVNLKAKCVIFGDFWRRNGNIKWMHLRWEPLFHLHLLRESVPSLSQACQRTTVGCEHKPGYLVHLLLCECIWGHKSSPEIQITVSGVLDWHNWQSSQFSQRKLSEETVHGYPGRGIQITVQFRSILLRWWAVTICRNPKRMTGSVPTLQHDDDKQFTYGKSNSNSKNNVQYLMGSSESSGAPTIAARCQIKTGLKCTVWGEINSWAFWVRGNIKTYMKLIPVSNISQKSPKEFLPLAPLGWVLITWIATPQLKPVFRQLFLAWVCFQRWITKHQDQLKQPPTLVPCRSENDCWK